MAAQETYDVLVAELPRLRQFSRFLAGSVDAGDDLFQDAVERAVSSIHQLNGATSPRAWLFTIARNRYIDLYRKTERQPDVVPIDEEVHRSASETGDFQETFLIDLGTAFERISPELREVTWLVSVQGFSYVEAAEVLKIPIGTVRSRMFRAREVMRSEMKDYWPDEHKEGGHA